MPKESDNTQPQRITEPLRQVCPDYAAISHERRVRELEKARAKELERLSLVDKSGRS
jgi:hypothetical protein